MIVFWLCVNYEITKSMIFFSFLCGGKGLPYVWDATHLKMFILRMHGLITQTDLSDHRMLILAVNKALENHNINKTVWSLWGERMDLDSVFTPQLKGGNAKFQSINWSTTRNFKGYLQFSPFTKRHYQHNISIVVTLTG